MPDGCWRLLTAWALLGLGACAAQPEPARLDVAAATIVSRSAGSELDIAVVFRPSATQLDALEHGVPLGLRLTASGDGGAVPVTDKLALRYFPLSRRYQLHSELGGDHSFALRGYLLDALEHLSVPLPHDPCAAARRCRLSVDFDYSGLPGALRLPALIKPAWRVPAVQHPIAMEPA